MCECDLFFLLFLLALLSALVALFLSTAFARRLFGAHRAPERRTSPVEKSLLKTHQIMHLMSKDRARGVERAKRASAEYLKSVRAMTGERR
jgi:hypothetical protein